MIEEYAPETQAVLEITRAFTAGEQLRLSRDADWEKVFRELQKQGILGVSNDFVGMIPMEEDLRKKWTVSLLRQMCSFSAIELAQSSLFDLLEANGICGVVLKGTAAAIYYPDPPVRTMGDIDVIVPQAQFEKALGLLADNGYREIRPSEEDNEPVQRHIRFNKDHVIIELHLFFAHETDSPFGQALERYVQNGIAKRKFATMDGLRFPLLPTMENGLVLLAHFRQHFVEGIGLRHLIDWLMFARKYLTDDVWFQEFAPMAEEIGLCGLATALTRLGQLWFGLPEENRTWCMGADEELCAEMLDYVLLSGNFGCKERDSSLVSRIVYNGRGGLPGFFRNLQSRGEANWKALQAHPQLRPAAWIYQMGRYVYRGLQMTDPGESLRRGLHKADMVKDLLARMEVPDTAKREPHGK